MEKLKVLKNGDRFLRFPEVRNVVGGLSRTTIWRLEKDGKFPKRRKISQGMVGWLESEVEEWMMGREQVQDQ